MCRGSWGLCVLFSIPQKWWGVTRTIDIFYAECGRLELVDVPRRLRPRFSNVIVAPPDYGRHILSSEVSRG